MTFSLRVADSDTLRDIGYGNRSKGLRWAIGHLSRRPASYMELERFVGADRASASRPAPVSLASSLPDLSDLVVVPDDEL